MSNLQALLVIQSNSCCSCANQVLESPKDGRPKKGATAAVFANEQIMYSGFRIDGNMPKGALYGYSIWIPI